jgi:hypothetical protein
MGRKLIDLAGRQIGLFTVLEYAGEKRWRCLCKCGAERLIYGHLIRGGIKPLCFKCSKRFIDHRLRQRILIDRDKVCYLAGIIDGEGCVSLGKRKEYYITPTLQITNTSRALMEWLKANCGGNDYRRIFEKRVNRKDAWAWGLCGQAARDVIEAVRPYLVIKQKQADLVLKVYKKIGRKAKRNSLGRLTLVMTEKEKNMNRKAISAIRKLNHRGLIYAP